MVESPRGCVLQWAGHAGYITERFSELFARQALVDVTLVCEEQKLRVHKLVLASNSLYFEEILQQDLGQEPIIFLKDLSFEILKAMVEFMYCGETTISCHLLPSLLTATKTFKVKQLASVIDTTMTSNIESCESSTNAGEDVCETKIMNNTCNDTDYIDVRYNEQKEDECFLLCDKSNGNTHLDEGQFLENNVVMNTPKHKLEHTLYEESQDLGICQGQVDTSIFVSNSVRTTENNSSIVSAHRNIKEEPENCSESSIIDNIYCVEEELKPILYEQCCDFSDIEECEETSMSLSRSCLQQIEKDLAQYSFQNTDVPSKVRKCVKVYTHKRRKSLDEMKNKPSDMNTTVQNPPSTDCIDLIDEPSTNDIPVTLLTSLDMESAEYIISLSTENIQSIVGATMNDQYSLNKCKKIKHIINYDNKKENINKKELNSENNENSNYIKPILRRSLRLNQQEVEEGLNNNNNMKESTVKEKYLKKSQSSNGTEFNGKGKRKVRDGDRKVPDHTLNTPVHSTKRNFSTSRAHKNTTKLIVKKGNKSTCSISNKEKETQKMKANSKLKCEMLEKVETSGTIFASAKFSAIEHINRALWGDMSDFLEDCENRINLSEYTPNTEIPFAVGLLPLRTALEKMQATPDYQPRKTRSSVAPVKQDTNNLKRKNYMPLESGIIPKKQSNYISNPKVNANTVCHIQIRTAPSQYIRNRRKFLTANITALEPASVMNS